MVSNVVRYPFTGISPRDRTMWQSKVKLNQGETLKHEKSFSKGSLGQEDITEYSVLNAEGQPVGSVKHTDHMSIKGFTRNQSVRQTDSNGKVVVDEHWTGD